MKIIRLKNILALLIFLILSAGTAHAASITVNYTADNYIDGFYLFDETTLTVTSLGPQAHWGDYTPAWQDADTMTIDGLVAGHTYQLIWHAGNRLNPDGSVDIRPGNPAAFMADLIFGSELILSSATSGLWEISNDILNSVTSTTNFNTAVTWETPTGYGLNGPGSGPAYGSNIWSVVSGINSESEWLWSALNHEYIVDQELFIRVTFSTPVPEPASMLLMGTGLLGLAGARLRRKKS